MLKNRLTYAAVSLALFLFIYLQEHRMTYITFYAVLLLPLLSYVIASLSKGSFSIEQSLNSDFVLKENGTVFKVNIRNHSIFPCSLAKISLNACTVGLNVVQVERYFSLLPYKKKEFDFQIKGVYRGQYQIGIKEITCYDFLGLFQFKLPVGQWSTLIVAPQLTLISHLPLDAAPGEVETSKSYLRGEDYTNIAELREFQPTDSYRQIHWKMSAKKGDLISKNFHEEEEHATVFFIDNRRTTRDLAVALPNEDRMMGKAVSVMSHCSRLGYPIAIESIGNRRVAFTTDFTHLYQEAAKIAFSGSSGFNALLQDYLNSDQVPMNLFVFVGEINEMLVATLQSLLMAGNGITIFLNKQLGTEKTDELKQLAINVVLID
ncbi:MAG: DUF58 domain-containing protein [Turicibacter sp.]|nr:DUF58 domain-containing protein [Turicibacter sp.]